jgi:hypothetical protein
MLSTYAGKRMSDFTASLEYTQLLEKEDADPKN